MKYPIFKNYSLFYIFGLFFLSTIIISCDKVNEPYLSKQTKIITKRKILLEEITGHKCVNCPEAHVILHELIKKYENNIIGVAIHATSFANPDGSGNYTADYRTTEGTKLAADYGATYAPTGFINRTKFNNKYLQGKDEWDEIIYQILNLEKATAQIEITNSYSTNDSTINSSIKGTFLTKLKGNFKLSVLIVEDSIVSPQKTNNPDVIGGYYPSYNHMHVLRKYITDIYGDIVAINQVDSADIFSKSCISKINKNWKVQNCKIIAFLTKEDTKEVIQAEEKKFIETK